MLVSAFKSYWKNSKYVFVAMGVIYFAMILGVVALAETISQMFKSVPPEVYEQIKAYCTETLNGVTVAQLFRKEFYLEFWAGLKAIVQDEWAHAKAVLTVTVNLDIALVVSACVVAQYLCRGMLRHEVADKRSIRGVLTWAIRWGLSVAAGYMIAYVGQLRMHALWVLIAVIVLKSLENLLATWIIHFRQYRLRDIFNLSNSLRMVGAHILLMLIGAVVLIALYLTLGGIVAILLALPIFVYTFALMDVTAAEHFRRLAAKGKLLMRPQKQRARRTAGEAAAVAIAACDAEEGNSVGPQITEYESETAAGSDSVCAPIGGMSDRDAIAERAQQGADESESAQIQTARAIAVCDTQAENAPELRKSERETETVSDSACSQTGGMTDRDAIAECAQSEMDELTAEQLQSKESQTLRAETSNADRADDVLSDRSSAAQSKPPRKRAQKPSDASVAQAAKKRTNQKSTAQARPHRDKSDSVARASAAKPRTGANEKAKTSRAQSALQENKRRKQDANE